MVVKYIARVAAGFIAYAAFLAVCWLGMVGLLLVALRFWGAKI